MSQNELDWINDHLEEALDGEELERGKVFAQTLIAYREQALEQFREEQMAGKMSETSEWIFRSGFQAGMDAFEEALDRSNPELMEAVQPVKERIEETLEDKANKTTEGDKNR
jgi:hypothetical protein